MGSEDAEEEPCRGPGIAEIEQILRLGKPSDPDAVHSPPAIVGWHGMRAERIYGCGGRQHILTLEQARDLRPTHRQRTQHQRTM